MAFLKYTPWTIWQIDLHYFMERSFYENYNAIYRMVTLTFENIWFH